MDILVFSKAHNDKQFRGIERDSPELRLEGECEAWFTANQPSIGLTQTPIVTSKS